MFHGEDSSRNFSFQFYYSDRHWAPGRRSAIKPGVAVKLFTVRTARPRARIDDQKSSSINEAPGNPKAAETSHSTIKQTIPEKLKRGDYF